MKRFKLLKDTMHIKEMRQADLAECISEMIGRKCSLSHLNAMMNGKYPWDLDEAYAALDILEQPHDRLSEFFPKGGMAQ